MARSPNAPPPSSPPAPAPPVGADDRVRVAVIGGGLAGMTTALQLIKRGFAVTLYEASPMLGGNCSSEEVNGVYHDVYPHMFCEWYVNMWELFEKELGIPRDAAFEARDGVQMLNLGKTDFVKLENATTLAAVMSNLKSGVASWPDLFLLGYSMLDLASHPFDTTGKDLFNMLDVNGFIYSRGYATQSVAELQNYFLMVIWSIQSEVTAAASYQDFIKHTIAFPHATPFCWLLNGSLQERIIQPFEKRLNELGCEIRKGCKVDTLEIRDGKPILTLKGAGAAPRGSKAARPARETAEADYAVVSVPGMELSRIVRDGATGGRIVDFIPKLSEVGRFWGEAIPVVDVYFKKTLEGLPKEMFALRGSDYDMTAVDISQLWAEAKGGPTALVVAASNDYALTATEAHEKGFQMIQHLHEFLGSFNPGKHWGDPDSDILWEKTFFRSNADRLLFANDVGSWQWRPVSAYPELLPSVVFAGDYCQTDVNMATMEAAVQSGVMAAQAVQAADAKVTGAQRGDPIVMAEHEVYSNAAFQAAKLAMMPIAYACTAWSGLIQKTQMEGQDQGVLRPNQYSPTDYTVLLPMAFALDWWKTAYWLARRLLPGGASVEPEGPSPLTSPTGGVVSAGVKAMGGAADVLQAMTRPSTEDGDRSRRVGTALTILAGQLAETVTAAVTARTRPASPSPGDPYQRRWRVKP